MFKIRKQMYSILTVSALSSFRLAGASWVALLAARGFSLVEIGLAESVFHLTSFLFEIPSGMIADVFGRKRSMLLSQWAHLFSAICMMLSETIAGVYVSMIFLAMGYNFSSGSREALAYDSLKQAGYEEKYLEFSSADLIFYRIGNASAILCAGLALLIGYKKAYLVDIILILICLAVSCLMKEVETEELQFEGNLRERIVKCFKDSFYFLIHNGKSIRLMLWNAVWGAISILTVYFLQAKLPETGINDALLGPALFVISMGGAVGARFVLAVKQWNYWKLSALCIGGVIAGLLCGSSNMILLMCLGGFVSNMCDDLLQVRTDAILNERFPSSQRATLVSVSSLCFFDGYDCDVTYYGVGV